MSSTSLNKNWIQFQGKQYTFNQFIEKNQNVEFEQIRSVINFIADWQSASSYILQKTSGSTGKPKSIKITKSQIKASAVATLNTLKIKANDHAVLCINAEYIGGKMMIARSIIGNLNLIIAPTTGNPLRGFKAKEPIDFFSFVPYQFERILEESPEQIPLLDNSKAIILGGAPVSDSLAEKITSNISKAKVYSTYGMTETVSHVALKLINSGKNEAFEALENIKFSVDERNCLVIHAPKITGKDILVTNDVVDLLSPTAFLWLGRHDFVINSGGIKIHPEILEKEIAELFQNTKINNRFFAFGLPDKKLGYSLNLVLEGNAESKSVHQLLKQHLKAFHSPKNVFTIEKFVETDNGKINRLKTIDKLALAK
ncbi:O-succinylbenzoic acid--CoA ligase [Marivirga tractuosa]|uniref:AMP-dependent synthetase and ligase n=1 Tax=Marivirga tractuosa (strain ATCC 23168 / DSM 4126 / NBRC 15989 / NCIMB 1408 / VKM B-1430 / H-43) TaxID=643867 RepID=E4TPB5_MARTH|nr:AMP-binding protein [Marivirga tractuosa]ADR20518.1 AMP-dependent synthetase and ligase [Marivirga tractuosa DSM 4126]BDD15034.1 O-succinylbenzoic acid--CoA ligase [Marivirga tractuosa]